MDPGKEEKMPSTYTDGWWIEAHGPPGESQRRPGVNCGKWLIFRPTGAPVDEAWKIISQATKDGKLGCGSKVSTMHDNQYKDRSGNTSHVICVYTYDYTDEDDVFRVRKALRDLGFTEKLPYKSDQATYANQYSHNTQKRVSLWYQ